MARKLVRFFAQHPFFDGVARVFDLSGALGSDTLTRLREKTAEEALREDWQRIGGDLRAALHRYEEGQRP